MSDGHHRTALRGTVAVVVSACCFGSISPLTVIATNHGMALESIQSWRYLTTAALLVVFGLWKQRSGTPSANAGAPQKAPWFSPRMLMLAGVGQATVATLALAALRWLPAATASFLFYTYPAWVALIAAVRGTEPLDRNRVGALLLSFVGLGAMVGAPDAASLAPLGCPGDSRGRHRVCALHSAAGTPASRS